jgi:hemoglobin
MSGTQTSIFDAIGGMPALVSVVDDFYRRVLMDPELAGFFDDTDMARLKTRQVEFFADALGGPVTYTGASMAEAHRGRGIGYAHFSLVAQHLVDALTAAGVPGETSDQIVGALAPLADDIVAPGAAPAM